MTTTEERSDVRKAREEGQPEGGTLAEQWASVHDWANAWHPTAPGHWTWQWVFEQVADLTAERDRARRVAVALEQQVAAVEALHGPSDMEVLENRCIHGEGDCGHDGHGPPKTVQVCRECDRIRSDVAPEGTVELWPCDTIRALSSSDYEDGGRD